LLLAHFGKEGKPESVVPKIGQEMQAEMIGTTRSRVSFFMNRFRKLGFVNYNGGLGGLRVHSSLLSVVLHRLGPAFFQFEATRSASLKTPQKAFQT
jgi:hypothetical protein